MIAMYGFAPPRVATIRIEHDNAVRTISPSRCGAFIAVAVGRGTLALTAMDHDGLPVWNSCSIVFHPLGASFVRTV
jgi:hypothetical protein